MDCGARRSELGGSKGGVKRRVLRRDTPGFWKMCYNKSLCIYSPKTDNLYIVDDVFRT